MSAEVDPVLHCPGAPFGVVEKAAVDGKTWVAARLDPEIIEQQIALGGVGPLWRDFSDAAAFARRCAEEADKVRTSLIVKPVPKNYDFGAACLDVKSALYFSHPLDKIPTANAAADIAAKIIVFMVFKSLEEPIHADWESTLKRCLIFSAEMLD